MLHTWNAETSQTVTRAPTPREIAEQTATYESIIAHESRIRPAGIMMSAIRSGCLEIVETVLASVGDCLAVRDAANFNTPLHFCSMLKGGAAIARLLIAKGHRPAAPNRYGWTPVDFARAVGNLDLAEVLTADYQEPDAFEPAPPAPPATPAAAAAAAADRAQRALSAAVRAGQRDLLRFLLAAPGLDVRAGLAASDPTTGNTPLHFAVLNNESPDLLGDLLRAGADPHAHNRQGRTALHLAEAKGRFKFVQALRDWAAGARAEADTPSVPVTVGQTEPPTSRAGTPLATAGTVRVAQPPAQGRGPPPARPPPLGLPPAAPAEAGLDSLEGEMDPEMLGLLVSGRASRPAGELEAGFQVSTPGSLGPLASVSRSVRGPARGNVPAAVEGDPEDATAESQERLAAMLDEIMDLRAKVWCCLCGR